MRYSHSHKLDHLSLDDLRAEYWRVWGLLDPESRSFAGESVAQFARCGGRLTPAAHVALVRDALDIQDEALILSQEWLENIFN